MSYAEPMHLTEPAHVIAASIITFGILVSSKRKTSRPSPQEIQLATALGSIAITSVVNPKRPKPKSH